MYSSIDLSAKGTPLVSAIPINLRRSPEHFSKSAIPQICAPSRAFSSPELRPQSACLLPKGFRLKALCRQIPVVDRPLRPRKKPRARPGASIFATDSERSVSRDGRAAELVVQASSDEIDVLTDAIGAEEAAARRSEGVGTVLHEQVIVLDANRPVRSKGVFEAGADGDRKSVV